MNAIGLNEENSYTQALCSLYRYGIQKDFDPQEVRLVQKIVQYYMSLLPEECQDPITVAREAALALGQISCEEYQQKGLSATDLSRVFGDEELQVILVDFAEASLETFSGAEAIK